MFFDSGNNDILYPIDPFSFYLIHDLHSFYCSLETCNVDSNWFDEILCSKRLFLLLLKGATRSTLPVLQVVLTSSQRGTWSSIAKVITTLTFLLKAAIASSSLFLKFPYIAPLVSPVADVISCMEVAVYPFALNIGATVSMMYLVVRSDFLSKIIIIYTANIEKIYWTV